MILRRTALALGTLALLGGLAACDLPGSAPAVVFDDRAPNDTPDDAQLVIPTHTIRGTVDAHDQSDWYRIQSPPETTSIFFTCHGNVLVELRTNGQSSIGSCEILDNVNSLVDPWDVIEVHAYFDSDEAADLGTYAIDVHYLHQN